MLKLNDLLIHSGKWAAALMLSCLLAGCGAGGGSDNILCGGDPCSSSSSSTDPASDTSDISNIQDQGTPDAIEFVSASPTLVSIKGAGGDETSVVTFLVTDTAGDPIEGVNVYFSIDTSAGGVSLANTSDKSNADGVASTIVQAGTVATPLRVRASVPSLSGDTVSDVITVSTGVADYNSLSLVLDNVNPDSWAWDGATVQATMRMGDIYNNPPADGTLVKFYTEGGVIGTTCTTVDGACSVTWTGTEPRALEGPRAGVSTILAVVTGAESFQDVNGNGVFDDGDGFRLVDTYVNGKLKEADDRPEPYLDENENGIYDVGEFYVDFNNNKKRDLADGLYNGPLCTHSTLCSSNKTIALGVQTTMVMSSAVADVRIYDSVNNEISVGGTLDLTKENKYILYVADENGNSLPQTESPTTTVTVSSTAGTINGSNNVLSYELRNAVNPIVDGFTAELSGSDPGQLKVVVGTKRFADQTFVFNINQDYGLTPQKIGGVFPGQTNLDATAGSDSMIVSFRDSNGNPLPGSFSWKAQVPVSGGGWSFAPGSGNISEGDDVTFNLVSTLGGGSTTTVTITVYDQGGKSIGQATTQLTY